VQSTSEHHLFRRGKRGTFNLRRRIPAEARSAHPPGQCERLLSLGTTHERVARKRLRKHLAALDEEFAQRAAKLRESPRGVQRVSRLSAEQLRDLAQVLVRATLETDAMARSTVLASTDTCICVVSIPNSRPVKSKRRGKVSSRRW
jgi:hypothetical protein